MDRREFFSKFSRSTNENVMQPGKGSRPRVLAGLETRTEPLDSKAAYHLLRRFTFGPPKDLVDQLTGKTPSEAVDMLLGDGSENPPTPPDWYDMKALQNPLKAGNPTLKGEIEAELKSKYRDFCGWWLGQMRNEQLPAVEKMTLFWSTVWTIEFTYDTLALIPPVLCYRNNRTLRTDRINNYKTLAEDITLDGAMLMYQSLYYSTKDVPNENYMREFMELFTMGTGNIFVEDSPNYTEGDIREGSRVLTGWRVNVYDPLTGPGLDYDVYFDPAVHDIGSKEFMSNTIPARNEDKNTPELVREEEIKGIINIMFSERADSIANFVANKIYMYFVYSNAGGGDISIIQDLAAELKNNDFEIKPVIKKLLTSMHFYDDANVGIQIKTPPEFMIGLEKQLGTNLGSRSNEVTAVFSLEQVLYDPPNVGSWDGYRQWISTQTFPLRHKYAGDLLAKLTDGQIVTLAKKFTGYDNASTLSKALIEYFFPVVFGQERENEYMDILLAGAGTTESGWPDVINNSDTSAAAKGLRAIITAFFKAPDFQLC